MVIRDEDECLHATCHEAAVALNISASPYTEAGPQGEDWPESAQSMTFVIIAHHTEILREGAIPQRTHDLAEFLADIVIHPGNGTLSFKSAPHISGTSDILFA